MRRNPQIMCFSVALLCIFGIGCAKNTTERPRTLQSRVADTERTHHEQAQRLTALEDRVGVLQNRTYEVTTASGQKTRYAVRAVDIISPAPLTGSTQPQNTPQAMPRPAPVQIPARTAPQSSSQTGTSLMLPPETAPTPHHTTPVASSPAPPAPAAPAGGSLALPPEGLPPAPASSVSPVMTHVAAPNFAPVTPPVTTPVTADAKLPPSAKGEEAAYTTALNRIRAGQYAQGRAQFEEFLQSYPAGRYAANAYYWMGESFYAQHQYAEALAQFNQAAARFPKHHKTADALLKAGLSSQKMGDTEGATRYFRTLLADFPQSEAAQTARNKGWGR